MTTPFSLTLEQVRIAVIGLGYVGLPLAAEFGKHYPTVGFDIKHSRIDALRRGEDVTGEVDADTLTAARHLTFTENAADLQGCNVFVVAVPTPIDAYRQPDLTLLLQASALVGSAMTPGAVVIYESTVYPGATEEDCLPVVERVSGLVYNQDFYAGYSPERINPGDKTRPLTRITKITSGSTPEVAQFVDALYGSIIEAGTHRASSMRVAEAAKIIENTQRDVNIALINELSIVLSRLNIDTVEVLEAAATKWNFINLRPGLVGGHCIGVDPYYLLHRASVAGYVPDMIRLAREINDGMAAHAASVLIKAMVRQGVPIACSRVLVLGLTFKENCADTRNTKVVDLLQQLEEYGLACDVVDPWACPIDAHEEYGVNVLPTIPADTRYAAVVVSVAHREFIEAGPLPLRAVLQPKGVLFDMKSVFACHESDLRL